ncbi:hypothetical protein [Pseudodesulfovibrio sediminis]|uniref:DUF4251 domain-containing protein n=1 Tax=Pseudodesulfovibrio sediminis TaxID=2810563 RepID=A0ABM7P822_9BACT|nr:hypothetical protein [Pseudodesulfovibrio sediminis]BCS89153.1 hypothetical protein PSDVSF_23950 [Pseudodesulfovibrio sediminis]
MKFRFLLTGLLFFLIALPSVAEEPDYLALLARESEIKAIATVAQVYRMGQKSDGTFTQVTFKRVYALTPFTPKSFVGGCKILDSNWQKRIEGRVYFRPKRGQKVFVTISTNGGAITSLTLMNPELNHIVREEPNRLSYSKGHATILPDDS